MELIEVDTCGLLCFRSPVCTGSCLNARLQKAHADGVEYMRLVVHHTQLTQWLSIDTSFKILIDGLLNAVQEPKMLLYDLTYDIQTAGAHSKGLHGVPYYSDIRQNIDKRSTCLAFACAFLAAAAFPALAEAGEAEVRPEALAAASGSSVFCVGEGLLSAMRPCCCAS